MIVVIGEHGVPQDVPPVDRVRGEALGASGADVVLVLDVEDGRARDARDDREWDRAQGDRGRMRCLITSQSAAQFPCDDRVEDVEVRRVLGLDQ